MAFAANCHLTYGPSDQELEVVLSIINVQGYNTTLERLHHLAQIDLLSRLIDADLHLGPVETETGASELPETGAGHHAVQALSVVRVVGGLQGEGSH